MADRFQGEATRSVRGWGFNTFKNPDVRYNRYGKPLFQGEPGKPDMDVWGAGRFCMIEVKDEYDSFPFANFEENKREYIRKYCTPSPYLVQVWIWLSLGTGLPNQKPDKRPRITWLIPVQEWFKAEELIKPIQVSIPYLAGPGYSTILQDQKLDAVHIFEPFVLKWKGAGTWAIPAQHPFYKMYIEPKPLPMYQMEDKSRDRVNGTHDPAAAGNHNGRRKQRRDTGIDFESDVETGKGYLYARQYPGAVRAQSRSFQGYALPFMEGVQRTALDGAVGKWYPV